MLKKCYNTLICILVINSSFCQSKKNALSCNEILSIVYTKDSVKGFFDFHSKYNAKYKSFEEIMIFYFEGKRINDTLFKVHWKNEEDSLINGSLKIKKNKVQFKFDDYPLGYDCCDLYESDFETECNKNKIDFIDIKKIEKTKVYIYSKPLEQFKTKMYFQSKDVVLVRTQKDGWLNVSYFNYNLNKVIRGFIKN